MGRTLHYGIKGRIELSEEQIESFLDLSKKYKEQYEWTCESVLLPSYLYLKHRENPKEEKPEKIKPSPENEKIIEDIKRTFETNIPGVEIYSVTHDVVPEDYGKYEIESFTKVRGNELNAHTIIKFVVEASKMLPDRIFYIHDEGSAIYCPLLIKNGFAMPDIESIKATLKYWEEKTTSEDNKSLFYKKLIKKDWEFTDINRFIRPLKDTAYLNKRTQTETINYKRKDVSQLPSMMQDFLIEERLEQISYYDDIDEYPELNII